RRLRRGEAAQQAFEALAEALVEAERHRLVDMLAGEADDGVGKGELAAVEPALEDGEQGADSRAELRDLSRPIRRLAGGRCMRQLGRARQGNLPLPGSRTIELIGNSSYPLESLSDFA